ncbi:restriction endonuclease subunit S [Lysobacteraceae bacterium NML93-0399]|nr:restriction endonuclease subunit S [Xanthomonadaceae bacterium NML93-0399]
MGFNDPLVRLGDYVEACLGKMLDAQKNRGAFQPYLGNSNVRWGAFDLQDLAIMRFEQQEEERYGLRDGDLVVCEGGEPGRCAIWQGEVPNIKIQKALHRIRVKDGLDNYFLYYWFLHASKTGALEPYFTGTTIKHLTGKALAELKIPLPPIDRQRGLAKVLRSLDDKIALNRRINQTLEAMAQAIFKSWFVDFDPVKAKIAAIEQGQDPLRAAMRAISGKTDAELDLMPREHYDQLAATAALFPDAMQESELGEIPKGWSELCFGDVAQQAKGTVNPATLPKELFTHYSLPAFDASRLPIVETGESIKSNKTPVADGAVLVSKLNPHIPRIWLIGRPGERAVCSTEFIVWTPKAPANNAFVYGLASSPAFNSAMRQLVTGTSNSHQRVKPEQLADIRVFAANDEAISQYSMTVASMMEKIILNREGASILARLRDTLLPKLLSGELRVPDTERITEAE